MVSPFHAMALMLARSYRLWQAGKHAQCHVKLSKVYVWGNQVLLVWIIKASGEQLQKELVWGNCETLILPIRIKSPIFTIKRCCGFFISFSQAAWRSGEESPLFGIRWMATMRCWLEQRPGGEAGERSAWQAILNTVQAGGWRTGEARKHNGRYTQWGILCVLLVQDKDKYMGGMASN